MTNDWRNKVSEKTKVVGSIAILVGIGALIIYLAAPAPSSNVGTIRLPVATNSKEFEEAGRRMRKLEEEHRDAKAREERGFKNLSMTLAKIDPQYTGTKVLLRVENKSSDEDYKWTHWSCVASLRSEPLVEFTKHALQILAGGTVYESHLIDVKYNPDVKVACRMTIVQ